MFTLKEIAKATRGELLAQNKYAKVTGVSTDTRTVKGEELFIALKGVHFDAHHFVKDAFKKGAGAAVVSNTKTLSRNIPLIKVKDTRTALGDIALAHRNKLKIPIVAITGSNGKTTTKDMIAHILGRKYKTAKTQDTENNLIGVPLTILKIKDESFAVIELGTNAPGEIEYLARITRPFVGIITNIGPSHLEGLGSLKGILREKAALFRHLEDKGLAVINKDDKLLSQLRIKKRALTFGITKNSCDFHADRITTGESGISFLLNGNKFTLQTPGAHNIYNALAAVCACSALGIDIKTARNALMDFKLAKMRFDICRIKGISIINDAYNSNPSSMKAAIEGICAFKTKGRRIVACADMLELGKDASKLHYQTGQMIAKRGIDILVTVGRHSLDMAKGARAAGIKEVRSFQDNESAASFLLDISKSDDTILVKGSRSMKMEELINCFTTCCTR
ncbi:MAG: UDP-N-acetylmuramoyl-tripeptide--D-alanyl-D-alanine ligase [Candidatus Omnitrophota bacterium]